MRKLARFAANTTLVIGSLAAVVLIIAALNTLGDYGAGSDTAILFGYAFGVFLCSAASASMLHLQASIDARLESLGGTLDLKSPNPLPVLRATETDKANHEESVAMFNQSRGED